MSILIEDAEQLAYMNTTGKWTKKPGEDSGFLSTRAALAAGKNEPIGKFNIVQFLAFNGQLINLDSGKGKGKETS